MLTRFAGQELIDGLSTVTLAASLLRIAHRRASSPLRSRLVFAFGGALLLFAARTAFSVLEWPVLHLLALLVVCALPLAALCLVEGVLRRHAPWILKGVATFGAIPVSVALVLYDGRAPAATWWLGCYLIPSLAGATLLLVLRDRASLSRQENAGVNALMAAGALLTLLSVTDFLAGGAVGLSGVGAAMVAYVLGANPASAREVRSVLLGVLALVLMAAASALLFAAPFGLTTTDETIRLGAVLLSLLLAANAVFAIVVRGTRSHSFGQALARADMSSLDAFLHSLEGEPLLAGLHLADDDMLADCDGAGLGAAMVARPVWTRVHLADRQAAVAPRLREELAMLMDRAEATHAVMLSRAPLRIALLTLPGAGPADGAEIDLALFRTLAAIAARETA